MESLKGENEELIKKIKVVLNDDGDEVEYEIKEVLEKLKKIKNDVKEVVY